MPYSSRICSIFPLWIESKSLVKSTNSIVASRFFARTPSRILRIVNICEVVHLFLPKPFWFFLRMLSDSELSAHQFSFIASHCDIGSSYWVISLYCVSKSFCVFLLSHYLSFRLSGSLGLHVEPLSLFVSLREFACLCWATSFHCVEPLSFFVSLREFACLCWATSFHCVEPLSFFVSLREFACLCWATSFHCVEPLSFFVSLRQFACLCWATSFHCVEPLSFFVSLREFACLCWATSFHCVEPLSFFVSLRQFACLCWATSFHCLSLSPWVFYLTISLHFVSWYHWIFISSNFTSWCQSLSLGVHFSQFPFIVFLRAIAGLLNESRSLNQLNAAIYSAKHTHWVQLRVFFLPIVWFLHPRSLRAQDFIHIWRKKMDLCQGH